MVSYFLFHKTKTHGFVKAFVECNICKKRQPTALDGYKWLRVEEMR